MSNTAEMDQRLADMQEASETLRMDIRQANEAVARLRAARKEVKDLLDRDIPRIVAEAVALHISRSNVESTRNR